MNHNHLIGNPYNLMYDVIHSIIFLPSIEYDQLFNHFIDFMEVWIHYVQK